MAYRPRTRVWAPTALPTGIVSLADLKAHLRVTDATDDAYIQGIGRAATAAVERWTQRLLTVRAATLSLQDLPSGQEPIELPGGDVASVTSVMADGVAITGCTAMGNSPAILVPAADWPSVIGEGYAVSIVYQVGYAVAPEDLRHAVKMIAADLYDTRANAVDGATNKALISAEWLMAPHRIWAAA